MKPKQDNQRDNANKAQNNIKLTTQNMETANELIGKTDEEESRRRALENMRKEIHEEAEHPRPTFP